MKKKPFYQSKRFWSLLITAVAVPVLTKMVGSGLVDASIAAVVSTALSGVNMMLLGASSGDVVFRGGK